MNWLSEYKDLPTSFVLTEHLNYNNLMRAKSNPTVAPEIKTSIKDLLKNLPRSGEHIVKYTRSAYGRYQPDVFCSTRMSRCLRSEVLGSHITDIDAVSCMSNIVVNLCKMHSICPSIYTHIEKYAYNRNPYIESLAITQDHVNAYNRANSCNYDKGDLGKLIVNMFCFGAGSSIYKKLGIEISHMGTGLAGSFKKDWNAVKILLTSNTNYADIVAYCKSKKANKDAQYHSGCALSMIVQSYETLLVYKLMNHIGQEYCETYEYDGLNVNISESKAQEILDEFDFDIPFAIKQRSIPLSELPFDESLQQDHREDQTVDYDDDVNAAKLIIEKHRSDIITIDSIIYVKQDNIFVSINGGKSEYYVKGLVIAFDFTDNENSKGTTINTVTSIICDIVRADPSFARTTAQITDKHIGMICFLNGVLDLKTQRFRPYLASDVVLQHVKHNYNATVIQEVKDKIIHSVLGCFKSDEQRDYFMYLIARAIAGHYKDKYWMILTGDRSSGKGMVQELANTLGRYSTTIVSPMVSDQTDNELVLGKFLKAGCDTPGIAWCNETAETTRSTPTVDSQLIKKLASGGDINRARGLYENGRDFVFSRIMCLCFNQAPVFNTPDVLQNCRAFDMPYTYDSTKTHLSNYRPPDLELKSWIQYADGVRDAFVSILLDSYQYTPTNDIVADCNPIKILDIDNDPEQILRSKCILGPDEYVKTSVLYELFMQCFSNLSFGRWLKKKYGIISKNKKLKDGTIINCYIGISIKPDELAEAYPDDDPLNELLI